MRIAILAVLPASPEQAVAWQPAAAYLISGSSVSAVIRIWSA